MLRRRPAQRDGVGAERDGVGVVDLDAGLAGSVTVARLTEPNPVWLANTARPLIFTAAVPVNDSDST